MTITIGLGEPGSTDIQMTPIKNGSAIVNSIGAPTSVVGNVNVPDNISQGIATRITPQFESMQTPGATTSPMEGAKNKDTTNDLPNVIPNALEHFGTCTALWTLAALTPQQYNDPLSYRNSPADLKNTIVFSSAGRYDSQRINTLRGTPEYFVDNVTIRNLIASNPKTGNSPASTLNFDIYEPYSMGVFLESLQNAAIKAGYTSYVGTPFVMRLDFQGYSDDGAELVTTKSKFFPIYITTAKFKVTEAGSSYKVTAVPYSDIGYSGVYNTTIRDLKLKSGSRGTVAEILKSGPFSLVSALNEIETSLLKEKRIGICNVFDIQFPPDSSSFTSLSSGEDNKTGVRSATSNPGNPVSQYITLNNKVKAVEDNLMNDIGLSEFHFDKSTGGIVPMARAGVAYDEKTNIVNPEFIASNETTREFQFPQGITIIDVISQVILSSDYVKKCTNPKNFVNGMIKYFMVDVQIELLDIDVMTGDYAKKITFRIIPYLVNQSMLSNPNTKPVGVDGIKKSICKVYDYIYTGKNTDVLKFDIDINNMFFIGVNPAPEKDSAKAGGNPDQSGIVESLHKSSNLVLGADVKSSIGLRAKLKMDVDRVKKEQSGGSGTKTTEQIVAEQFHNALIQGSSADLIALNLEILGDPYWLSDSGISNYFAQADVGNGQKTVDGAMNHQDGQVYIYIRFRSPIDMREDLGYYQFTSEKSTRENDFSGVYRVVQCDSTFSGGMFKQKLRCIRIPKQADLATDTQSPAANTSTSASSAVAPAPSTPPNAKADPETTTVMQVGPDLPPPATMNQGLAETTTPPVAPEPPPKRMTTKEASAKLTALAQERESILAYSRAHEGKMPNEDAMNRYQFGIPSEVEQIERDYPGASADKFAGPQYH